jgi:hypothetical protein
MLQEFYEKNQVLVRKYFIINIEQQYSVSLRLKQPGKELNEAVK